MAYWCSSARYRSSVVHSNVSLSSAVPGCRWKWPNLCHFLYLCFILALRSTPCRVLPDFNAQIAWIMLYQQFLSGMSWECTQRDPYCAVWGSVPENGINFSLSRCSSFWEGGWRWDLAWKFRKKQWNRSWWWIFQQFGISLWEVSCDWDPNGHPKVFS
jgi:hypothetical protein